MLLVLNNLGQAKQLFESVEPATHCMKDKHTVQYARRSTLWLGHVVSEGYISITDV